MVEHEIAVFDPGLEKAILKNMDMIQNYPDPDYIELKSLIAEYAKTSVENIIAGNGGTELIFLFSRAMKYGKALIAAPTFMEYSIALSQAGTKIDYYKLDPDSGFNIDISGIKQELKKRYDLLVICNPNNPTGSFLNYEGLDELLASAAEYNTDVFVDESFIEFVNPDYIQKTESFYKKHRNVFILRSLTKFFAIPGLRLGYAVSYNKEILQNMKKHKEPWTINQFAEIAAKVLLNDKSYILKTIECINTEKKFLYDELDAYTWLFPYRPNANFLLVKLLSDMTAHQLKEKLIEHSVLIRDASNFKFLNNKYFRIAVKTRKHNKLLLKLLSGFGVNRK